MAREVKLSDEEQGALLAVLDKIEQEDKFIRLYQLREYKKYNRYWHGFQYLFWSESDQDWRIPTHDKLEEVGAREETKYIYDYVINIFKAHGESIIAALSTDLPDVRFGPLDAQDADDNRAVDAATAAAELIIKDNRSLLLIIQALFYICTEGFAASYRYNHEDEEYGTVEKPKYANQQVQTTPDMAVCPSCNHTEPHVAGTNDNCQACGDENDIDKGTIEDVPIQDGTTSIPKSKEIIEVYGALNVRVPSYATTQKECGYLIRYIDNTPQFFMDKYEDLDIELGMSDGTSSEDTYERLMRASSISDSSLLNNLITEKHVFIRNSSLYYIDGKDSSLRKSIKKKFQKGISFSVIGSNFLCAWDCGLDEHWSITKAGPTKGVHADPLLKPLASIQDLKNNGTNYLIQMMEYQIPIDFADTEVYDFEGMQRAECAPGYVYPASPKAGQTIADAFYSSKTANLSKEAAGVMAMLDTDAQFTIGSFPSIFGGPATSGSKTLGEYEKSRAFALQRLSLVWYFLNTWWGETIEKAVKSFIDHQLEDEKITRPAGEGFVTSWIKQADFKGSFERIEPEVSSSFPMSYAQKRSVLLELAGLNNDQINAVLYDPENSHFVKNLIGLREIKVPQEFQRGKQLREIVILIQSQPVEDGMGGPPTPTVQIDVDVDNHAIHMDILQNFLVSDGGMDLFENNPGAYANCIAHFKAHKMALMASMPSAPPPDQKGPEPQKAVIKAPPSNNGGPA